MLRTQSALFKQKSQLDSSDSRQLVLYLRGLRGHWDEKESKDY